MSVAGKICVRPLADLMQEHSNISEDGNLLPQQQQVEENLKGHDESSPSKSDVAKRRKKAVTTVKKANQEQITTLSTIKRSRTSKKSFTKDDRQKTIDSFFKSASKTYQIEPFKETRSPKKPIVKKSRRRITYNDKSDTTTLSNESKYQVSSMRKTRRKPVEFIDLCADSDAEEADKIEKSSEKKKKSNKRIKLKILESSSSDASVDADITIQPQNNNEQEETEKSKTKSPEKISSLRNSKKNFRKLFSSSSSEKSEEAEQQNGTASPVPAFENDATKQNRNSTSEANDVFNKISSKTIGTDLQNSVSSEKPERTVTQAAQSKETESGDEIVPASLENEIVPKRKKRKNLSVTLAVTKQLKTKSRYKVSSTATTSIFEPVVSIRENSPPTTSSGKENCVPDTPSHNNFPRCKETTEVKCSTISETTFASTKIEADIIVDISDDDFEYVQPSTSAKTKPRNSRKSRSKTQNNEPAAKKTKKSPRAHPPYKIIEGTNGTMAVDAFCYGDIEGVSHYFLTHFHADHYVGLTRKFSHDIYMSTITARLVRAFIPIEEQYIKEMQLNTPIKVDDIEVTAIDANHCPGAIMLIFKLPNGRCLLHTGDFRASMDMESEPIFWNNDIETIYLDTTYIHQKNIFCHQNESVERAQNVMQEFLEKNVGTRTLFVCGSYLIGKEKFWSALASHFKFKVFAEGNRKKSLLALNDETLNALLTEQAADAQMHVLPMQKINYNYLLEYLEKYAKNFDLIFALRPSGWEKNSKPQYRGKINIIGIEYSEHSSRDEMQRFVQYLKPQNVISTVPVNSNAMITAKIPKQWYKYTTLKRQYQPSITTFFKMKPANYFRQLTEKYSTLLTDNSTQHGGGSIGMLISPETINNDAVDKSTADHIITASNLLNKLEEPLKLKQEIHTPVVEEPIVIDCDTDDDWLT